MSVWLLVNAGEGAAGLSAGTNLVPAPMLHGGMTCMMTYEE